MTSALLLALATTTGVMSAQSAQNSGPIGVYVDFATGPDEASAALGVAPADSSRPVGQSWFTSPVVTHVFGGVPTASQQQQFKQAVVNGLNQDYAAAGLPVHFSTDPAGTDRELGVLSNATSTQQPSWIGVGAINGRDAVSFLDHLDFAPNEQSLVNAVRHNGDHEIGHTLGMEHTSADGFINSAVISTSALMNDSLAFTPDAVQAIRASVQGLESQHDETGLHGQTVIGTPEPASWLVLSMVFGIGLGSRRRKSAR